jgi:hypothetical protein
MSQPQRVSIEQIIKAYEETGSVWKAARLLGVVGQSVWERLKSINYPMPSRVWAKEEIDEMILLAQTHPIGKIAQQLGRPYYGVAIKLSRLGIARLGHKANRMKIPRGIGLDLTGTRKHIAGLRVFDGTLRQFAKMNAVAIDPLVNAIQKYEPLFWTEYSSSHSDIGESKCEYCEATFFPMTSKQRFCTSRCSATKKRDEEYFGGRRRDTVGLESGICQLCDQAKDRLSSHHVLGKENDPDNTCLVAVCSGCHQLIGTLANRRFTDQPDGWENLIHLVMARRMAEKSKEFVGVYACVELEYLTAKDVTEMTEEEPQKENTNGRTLVQRQDRAEDDNSKRDLTGW